jgi:hypothetical protein
MVLRIRDLLYEEKFTIAGAKKRLLDEMRGGSARTRLAEDLATEENEPPEPTNTTAIPATEQSASPQTRSVLRILKRDLEDLLTRLNTDASIKR